MGAIKALIASQIRDDADTATSPSTMLLLALAAALASAVTLLDVNGICTTLAKQAMALFASA